MKMSEKVSTTITTYHSRGKWSQEATKLLVTLYEQHPCLYQRSNPHYRNKQVRQNALVTITNLLNKAIHVNFTTRDVLTKINSIRTQFSVVHNSRTKRLAQLANGTDIAKIKQPSWWLYPQLKFLMVHCRRSAGLVRDHGSMEETTSNNNTYQNKGNFKIEVIELDEPEQEESEDEQPELRLSECYEQEYLETEPKIEPSVIMADSNQESHEGNVRHDEIRSSGYQSECMDAADDSVHTPEVKYNADKNDYITVSLNHLKLELESIRNPQTQRVLLRKMFQLIYDAQDQE